MTAPLLQDCTTPRRNCLDNSAAKYKQGTTQESTTVLLYVYVCFFNESCYVRLWGSEYLDMAYNVIFSLFSSLKGPVQMCVCFVHYSCGARNRA